jgi:hypothetical protein
MLDLFQIADQFDSGGSPEEMEKRASFLEDRQVKLASAPFEDFAVVLYDGTSYARKFPVQTAKDVQMSKEALDQNAPSLPEEVVKVARYHIELAGREKLGESLYSDVSLTDLDAPKTNVLYAGAINRAAHAEKLASLEKRASTEYLVSAKSGMNVPAPQSVRGLREVERALEKNAYTLTPDERVEAARNLAKVAARLESTVESQDLARYNREALPAKFASAIKQRQGYAPPVLRPYFDRLTKEAFDMGIVRTAQCLRVLDQMAGFTAGPGRPMTKVGHFFPSVDDVCFPVQEAVESEADLTKIADVFGDTFATEFASDPQSAMSTLTAEEQRLLNGLVN